MSDDEEVRSLFRAVSCGESEEVEELVNRYGLSYSLDFCEGYALLFNAAFFGYKNIVKFLLEKGAKVNSEVDHADTPLHFATWFGDSELMRWLLDHGALINVKDRQNESPLHIACRRGRVVKWPKDQNVVKLLLDRGADPNTVRELPAILAEKFAHFKVGGTAFAAACKTGHEDIEEVLEYGAQIDDSDNDKLLHLSSAINRIEIADQITENEGNVTPLHLAAEMGSLNVVKLLLNNGASVNAQTSSGLTPLLLAIKCRHSDVAQTLLENGACVNMKDDNDNSPLYVATETRNSPLVSYLLQRQPIIDHRIQELILDIVAHDKNSYHKIVNDFVKCGFMPDGEDAKSFSFLEAAVQKGYTKLVESLLKQGAKCGDSSKYDPTLLNLAVESGEKEMIELFLDSGYDKNAKDKFGRSPISYAMCNDRKDKDTEIIQLLFDRGADVKEVPDLLHKAVDRQNIDVCKILIENRVDVNSFDENGMTPLHCIISERSFFDQCKQKAEKVLLGAQLETEGGSTQFSLDARSKREDIVRLLLNHGADVESRRVDDATPLHWACWQGDLEMVNILLNNAANVEALRRGAWKPARQGPGSNGSVSEITRTGFFLVGGHLMYRDPQYRTGNFSNLTEASGVTPLHIAAGKGHADIVETLFQFRADPDVQTVSKETALHYAVMRNHSDVVSVLLKSGCDVNIENDKGNTALGVTVRDVTAAVGLNLLNVDYQDLIIMLKRHIIKLQVAGLYVCKKNIALCDESGLDNFMKDCEEEVNRMKCENLTNEFNLHGILDKQRFCNSVRNESLIYSLDAFDFGKFPIYEDLLRSSVKMSKDRLEMMTAAGKWLDFLIKTSRALNRNKLSILPNELLEKIVSLLSKRDLNVLICCGKNLKRQVGR